MKAGALWIGGIAAGALVWAVAPELHWPARLLMALLLGPAPVVFLMQAGGLDDLPRPLPRIQVYIATIVGLWILAFVTVAAAAWSHFTARLIGLHPLPAGLFLLWTLVATLAAAAVVAAFKGFGHRDVDVMIEIVPQTALEKVVFVLLSITAGICEELTFRGFLLTGLIVATGSTGLAVLLSSFVFGLMHAHQGAGGALRAAALGAVLCVPVLLTGSLYPAMAAHALADVAGGLWLARWLLRY
jgi:membrane protease YdiL (CAAX protease family)